MLLVSGDIARRTGGNLYDRRMERACRRAGVPLRIVPIASTAEARTLLARLAPRVIVIDSIAIPLVAPLIPWARRTLGARLVTLMHMPTTARGTRLALRSADRVVAVSATLARTVARAGVPRSRIAVIAPGCDGVPRVVRRPRETRDTHLRVLSVANWSPAKGTLTLVAAAARVPDVELHLVGDAGSRAYGDAVQARIRSRVRGSRVIVHGVLAERRLARRYAEADVFALPTESEGYGTVFAEALARGLPIIAADIAPIRQIVRDAGLFVPPRRVRPLTSALRLMTDPWLRRRLARAARARGGVLPTWALSERAFVTLLGREMRMAVGRA